MADAKTAKKTYIRPDNTAVVTCPHCGNQETLHVEKFKEHKSKIKIKCNCKNIFTAILEFRQRVRKMTNLKGSFINHSKKGIRGSMKVKNISVSGLEFSTLEISSLDVDDELTVHFKLDDQYQSEVRREVIVRNVRTTSVGCEFVGSGNIAYDGPLGLYIMK